MAIVRTPASGKGKPKTNDNTKFVEQRNRVRTGEGIYELIELTDIEQPTFDTKNLPVEKQEIEVKVKMQWRYLHPKGDVSKGHGAVFTLWPRLLMSRPKKGKSASALYELCRAMFNDGDALSDEQMNRATDLLNEIEQRRPFFQMYGFAEKDGAGNVKLARLIRRVEEDEYLPTFALPVDPRSEEFDDPSIVCSVSGERIRGWELTDDSDFFDLEAGDWVSAATWAEAQVEILNPDGGDAPSFQFEGYEGEFSPPFSGKFYRLAKQQLGL